MPRCLPIALLLAALFAAEVCAATPDEAAPAETVPAAQLSPRWQPWSDALFAQARREHKFILLDMEALWCR